MNCHVGSGSEYRRDCRVDVFPPSFEDENGPVGLILMIGKALALLMKLLRLFAII